MIAAVVLLSAAAACPGPGTYSVGPTGSYPSLAQAFTDIGSCALTGPIILELQPTYNSSVETFPLTLPAWAGSSAVNTVTIRPASGATALQISSAAATGIIHLQGARYIFFDGRPGGTGSSRELTIQNTLAGTNYTLQFTNDASENSFRFCKILGSNSSTSSGTIVFGAAGSGNGNDNNLFSDNEIGDASGGTPVNAVYAAGTSAAKSNSGNQFNNNLFYNHYHATSNTCGMLIDSYADNWIIQNNHFYQTTSRSLTANTYSEIQTNQSTVGTIQISSNFIGGSASNAGGTAMTLTGSGNMQLIRLITATTTTSTVTGNTIRNVQFTSTNNGVNALILVNGGRYQIGSLAAPNTIGNTLAASSIKINLNNSTASPNNPVFGAIYSGTGTADSIIVEGNTIGGMDFTGSSVTAFLNGIYLTGNTALYRVSGNTIGSKTMVNNVLSTHGCSFLAIWLNSSNATAVHQIDENHIRNLRLSSTSNGNLFYGILAQGSGTFRIRDNWIAQITSNSANTGNGIQGIFLSTPTTGGSEITGNQLYNYLNTNSTTGNTTSIAGIFIAAGGSSPIGISRNLFHSFESAGTNQGTNLNAIYIQSGSTTITNNMIRLGLNSAGGSISKGHYFRGILDQSAAASNVWFNSVFIGGDNVENSIAYSFCYYSGAASALKSIQNNIFFNERRNLPANSTTNHYCMRLAGLSNYASDYNVFYLNGSPNGVIGWNGTAGYTTLASWIAAAPGLDANSASSDPQFMDPRASGSAFNLHINPAVVTPVESAGTPAPSVTEDYDKELRASFTPVDIGADAGNFKAYLLDLGVIALVSPQPSVCYPGSYTATVTIKNYSGTTVNFSKSPIQVNLSLSGPSTVTFTESINTGIIAAGGTLDYTFTIPVNLLSGSYTVQSQTLVSGISMESNTTNDAMPAAIVSVASVLQWTGTTNADWNTGSNWCGGSVPTLTTRVKIPALGPGTYYPVVASGQLAEVRSLEVATGASLSVQPNATLHIDSLFKLDGTLTSGGLIELSGTANSQLPGNGQINYLNDLTLNLSGASLTINDRVNLRGRLLPQSGSLIINDTLALVSNADSTAMLGNTAAAFTFNYGSNGKVEIQRYIPNRRAWRLLTAPLKQTGSLYNTWQNNGVYNALNLNRGMLITGPGANPAVNGLDLSAQNQTSLKYWDTATQSLKNISNTLSQLLSANSASGEPSSTGYFTFVRGDRDPSNTLITNSNSTTLFGWGQFQTGNQTIQAASSSGNPAIKRLTLVANPYASPIDFAQLTRTNLNDLFYTWDPQAADVGRYVTVMNTGSGYVAVPDRGADGPNQIIQSGQSFFVETALNTSITPTIAFSESSKSTSNRPTVFRPASTNLWRVDLYRADSGRIQHVDGTAVIYSTFRASGNPAKMSNINETIGIEESGQMLAASLRNPVRADSIQLLIRKYAAKNYKLHIQPGTSENADQVCWLYDRFKQTSTPVSYRTGLDYSFNIQPNDGSNLANRLIIYMQPLALDVTLNSQVTDPSGTLQLSAAVTYPAPGSNIVLERIHVSGNETTELVQQVANGNDWSINWQDHPAKTGWYRYRISIRFGDESKIIRESPDYFFSSNNTAAILGNPVTGPELMVYTGQILNGTYQLAIYNTTGQILESYPMQIQQSNLLRIPNRLHTGTYRMILRTREKTVLQLPFVVNR